MWVFHKRFAHVAVDAPVTILSIDHAHWQLGQWDIPLAKGLAVWAIKAARRSGGGNHHTGKL